MRGKHVELVGYCHLNKTTKEGERRRRRKAGVTYLCKKSNMLEHTSLVSTIWRCSSGGDVALCCCHIDAS